MILAFYISYWLIPVEIILGILYFKYDPFGRLGKLEDKWIGIMSILAIEQFLIAGLFVYLVFDLPDEIKYDDNTIRIQIWGAQRPPTIRSNTPAFREAKEVLA